MLEKNKVHFGSIAYLPYDLPGPTRRALRFFRPDLVVLEYLELWPALLQQCQHLNIPVVLHNGRINPGTFKSYRYLFALTGNLLRPLELLLMRDAEDAKRAKALGACPDRIHITGNTKFDNLQPPSSTEIDALGKEVHLPPGTPLWIAGSTHHGEEAIVLRCYARLLPDFPDLRLVIAPRYSERAPRICAMAKSQKLNAALRSKPPQQWSVLVVDTIGELATWYGLADVAFVGGSFTQRGGQNILEPAAAGKPVLFGPSMHNFADAVALLQDRGGKQTHTPQMLEDKVRALLADPTLAHSQGLQARARIDDLQGAATRNAQLILSAIDTRAVSAVS